jgi:cardiolipin synthase C
VLANRPPLPAAALSPRRAPTWRFPVVLALVAIAAQGCDNKTPQNDGQAAAAMAPELARAPGKSGDPTKSDDPVTVLHPAFDFECSSDKVACGGVLPVRTENNENEPNRAALLHDGPQAFSVRLESLRNAARSIRIQSLIFRGDESGLAIADLLKKKRTDGLDVRVIVDATSNLDWRTQWMYFDLKQHGIEVEGYEALYLQWITAELKPQDPLRVNKRFHDKMWVVDGEDPEGVAIVGGRNIANEYFRFAEKPIDRWRDQDIVLRGAVVKDVVAAFDRNYAYSKSLKRKLLLLNPDNAWKLTRAVLNKIRKVKGPTWLRAKIQKQVEEVAVATTAPLHFEPITSRFLQSRPRLKETFIHQAYEDLIDSAKKEIFIANAYFLPCRQMVQRLKEAARRGVQVKIITNSPDTNDIRGLSLVSRFLYKALLDVNAEPGTTGSLQIYEWIGPRVGEGTLHAKFAVMDRELAIVGAYNLDPRSERLNSETAIALKSPGIAGALADEFSEKDLPNAQQITATQAEAFHRPDEAREAFKLRFALSFADWF